jgi:hypothetical protein
MNWQRTNVQTAAAYMRDHIASGADDVRTKAVYEGLLDVLEPTRRTARLQREAAKSLRAAVVVQTARDRRNRSDRRRSHDRRLATAGPPGGVERRRAHERRNKNRRG